MSGFTQYGTGRLTRPQYRVCAAGILVQTGWPRFTSPGGLVTEMYSYHPAGVVTAKRLQVYREWTDGAGGGGYNTGSVQALYAYDSAGRTTSYGVSYPPNTQTLTYTYGYDSMSRPVSLTDNYTTPLAWVQNANYDLAGRMTDLKYVVARPGNFDPATTVWTSETMGYNVNGQLASLAWGASGVGGTYTGLTGGITYQYSTTQNNGQITGVTDTLSGETVSYQYL